ncbi:hypothetical protein SCHPADRAFT_892434 [Schizopora paradoxa]|uniref:Uncharacterized protein n=1 Tax=Schizopora paradoxa TaxID=27342 RepID=A0A0H2RZY4_9AGAM|nr:hypothetical protein SCHPADRAFT_892434 [Schizopora paradoxa]
MSNTWKSRPVKFGLKGEMRSRYRVQTEAKSAQSRDPAIDVQSDGTERNPVRRIPEVGDESSRDDRVYDDSVLDLNTYSQTMTMTQKIWHALVMLLHPRHRRERHYIEGLRVVFFSCTQQGVFKCGDADLNSFDRLAKRERMREWDDFIRNLNDNAYA